MAKLRSEAEFDNFTNQSGLNLVLFGANWSDASSKLNDVLTDLTKDLAGQFKFSYCDAEDVSEAALKVNIEAVPTVVFFKDGKSLNRIDGFHPTEIRNAIITQSFSTETGGAEAPVKDLNARLRELINKERVTLFMKGLPAQPRCGFSRKIVELLNENKIKFYAFDILSDEEVRQGLKKYSDWPTYPQLYLDGELLGGLDVVNEEFQNPEFVSKLPKIS
ncbi:unnamed protein product [Bursaphelenchus xylophilus]|uniref:(pine wood nematode) hypothetical protein n=1 Tax=Bursaphelenchus xylophilus TaxID=6326 RepID=A0A1I7RSA0_BURXY|nr:unnamed protein product [Bursaphelenchus xylophilus]CAG9123096.1 unnamed protein product [Bursaphelenchus xylophilus]